MLRFEGHAIVSADGMIADGAGEVPPTLHNAADWRQYQAALDRSEVVITGRRGHERFPNPGRRRLVLTRGVPALASDPRDGHATFWNPAGIPLEGALAEIGIGSGLVAIAAVFDLFLPIYDAFQLSESNRLLLPGGMPCFAAGHPRSVLATAGLYPGPLVMLDADVDVTSTLWRREATPSLADGEPVG